MSYYKITGGNRLEGTIAVQGAKNAVLPLLAAASICGDSKITNCPQLTDVDVALDILAHLGCGYTRNGSTIHTVQTAWGSPTVPDELMMAMRSSIVFLGATLSRFGRAEMALPGGCELGGRPIDLHISSLERMGAEFEIENCKLSAYAPIGLHGAEISLPFPSVGATENIIIAATCAKGVTKLWGGAKEPEVFDVIHFLNKCGAKISVLIDGSVEITGVPVLHGCTHCVIADRIVAGTYLCGAALTNGMVELKDVKPRHLYTTLAYLSNAGCMIETGIDYILCAVPKRLRALGTLTTAPYPGLPTDIQALLVAAATKADGNTVFTENIFSDRYRHTAQLNKLGAKINVQEKTAIIEGVKELYGAEMECTDLRGGAAMVIAALGAGGESKITKLCHVDRGYENFEQALKSLGAKIERYKE